MIRREMYSTGRIKLEIAGVLVAVLFFCPLAAGADAGVPMLPIAYPVVLFFLLPVVAIEAVYLQMRLRAG